MSELLRSIIEPIVIIGGVVTLFGIIPAASLTWPRKK